MAKCFQCGSSDADIDLGLCYECFCQSEPQQQEQYPEPSEQEHCASYGHPQYFSGNRCYCGEVYYDENGNPIPPEILQNNP
jgi:NMD protein affecting ribosome stability and mRNA decay